VVEDFCKREKIDCFYAHDAFKDIVEKFTARRLFYDYDFHPNEEGNVVLGNWVARQLSGVFQRD
jgi:hypothetical protein